MLPSLLAPACALLLAIATSSASASTSIGPNVRDVVEFTRLIQPDSPDPEAFSQQVSPDGGRAFIVTRKADVAADRNRYEIRLLQLSPEQLAAGRPAAPETVFSFEATEDPSYADPPVQRVRWHDDRTLVFYGRLKDGVLQAYRLDLATREVVQLTHEATPVVSFALSADQRRLVYAAQFPNPPMKDGARSIVIGNQSFWSVRWGQQRLQSQVRKYRFYVSDVGSSGPARPLGEAFFESNAAKPVVSISPDGRWAVLPRYEPHRTLAWSDQYPLVGEVTATFARALKVDPLHYFSGAAVKTARRMTAWRLDDAREQTIVDAPDDSSPGSYQYRSDRLWPGKGASLVLGGTHLPPSAKDSDRSMSYVIEYWPDSDRWSVITSLRGRLEQLRGNGDGFIVDDDQGRRYFRRTQSGGWQERLHTDEATTVGQPQSQAGWSYRVQEALNQPPDVMAFGPAGQKVRLTTLNPQFDAASWGVMKPYAWRDVQGREWTGGLLEPAAGQRRGKMPLVIQAYVHSPDKFYLDGPNAATGFTSAYPGRAFVREGVLVLAMSYIPKSGGLAGDSAERLRRFNEEVRGAIDALVSEGRVDPERVGIIGFSTTGEMVLNLVTFSDVLLRAATIADGDANTLFSYAVTHGSETWQRMEQLNLGLPVGATRSNWLSNDPALNTDCVRSALRIESYGVPVYANYDVYALLRRQYKPVEMVLIPGGAHSLSKPSERMISLQGNVDWYRFWLKGEERADPALVGETPASLKKQYVDWRQMKKMKADNDAKPRCEREPSRG